MPLSTPRTCILERVFKNNEEPRTAISLRCRNAVLGIQSPSPVVLYHPFVYIVIRVVVVVIVIAVVVAVVVCSVEIYN